MTHKISAMIVSMAFVFASALALAQDAAVSPFIGSWKMNIAKSKFEGTPPVKSYSITITDAGDGKLHNLAQWVDGDGTKAQAEYTTRRTAKQAQSRAIQMPTRCVPRPQDRGPRRCRSSREARSSNGTSTRSPRTASPCTVWKAVSMRTVPSTSGPRCSSGSSDGSGGAVHHGV